MKKIILMIFGGAIAITLILVPKTHAYTLSNVYQTYYNQSTDSIGQADLLDIGDTYIEYMYFNLGNDTMAGTIHRVVFTDIITTKALRVPYQLTKTINVEINFYNVNNILLYSHQTKHDQYTSFSYFETNFYNTSTTITGIDYITISITNLSIGYNQDTMHTILNGAIIANGNSIINQTIDIVQYGSGWDDAMGSKVTQIWDLWGNIFDTFMSVFNVFSIKLMGDITIGHIALVPLVLGLIGFIYALGGKRGR